MANPLSRFITDRLLQPAIDSQVEKALSSRQPAAYGVSTTGEVSLAKAIGQPHDADYALLYALYKLNVDVSACVHEWAGGVTGPGWRITTMDDQTEITPELQNDIDEITRWLKNPNPSKLFEVMLYEGVEHFGVTGDFFWYVSKDSDGKPMELWPMHPALTKVVATKGGEILGYVMRNPGGEPITFEPDEVLHFRLPNITNDLYGESPTELVLEEAGIDLMALRSNKAVFQNGLNPSGILFMDEKTSVEQAQQVTNQIKQAHTGADKQHKIMAIAKTRDFKITSTTLRDMEFTKLRDLSTSKVTSAFRLPKVMLGYHKTGDYATTKFLIRKVYAHVYEPMQRIIAEVITERLIHLYNPELKFVFNKPDASDPDDIRKDQMAAKDKGILTADEVRADSFGKEPIPGLEGDGLDDKAGQPTEADQQPDADATTSADDAPNTSKSVTKALSPDDYGTEEEYLAALARERDAIFDRLVESSTPSIANYFSTYGQTFTAGLEDGIAAHGVDGYLNQTADAFDTILSAVLVAALLPALTEGSAAAMANLGFTFPESSQAALVAHYSATVVPGHAAGINTTTRTKLSTTLNEGIKAKETAEQLRLRAEQIFQEGQEYRAALIAETESVQAFDHANYESVRASGLTLQEIEQVWLTERDTRVCEICLKMDFLAVPMDESFLFPETEIEMKPGSVHTRCRCTRYFRRIFA